MITTGHLCSGYDGLGLALSEVEAHETLWHSEIDVAASRVLLREQPEVPNAGNLVKLLLDDLWRLAPSPDLVTAGFPCQPVSSAGRGLAQLDPRWLWPFVIEIFRQVRPFRIVIENVARLVTIQGSAVWREVLGDLRAAGYAARWVVMGACSVGAPHHRHRVFLVADLVTGPAPEAVRVERAVVCGAPRSGGRVLLPTPRTTDTNGPGRGDRLQGGNDLRTVVSLLPTPTVGDAERGSGSYGSTGSPLLGAAAQPALWGRYAPAVELWERVTGVPAPEPTEFGAKGQRRLSPHLPEWLMGVTPGYLTKGATRAEAIRLAGNGVVPLQAAAAYRMLS